MKRLKGWQFFLKFLFSVVIVIASGSLCAQTPTITSFTPTSGPIGTVVTISGSGFDPAVDINIVWFGAVKAVVTAASPTILTVTVPAGATYQPITVTVNGLTACSGAPFNVTFASSYIIDATAFAPRVDLPTGTGPYSIAISDIDVDGKPDLVVTKSGSSTFSVYRNISTSPSISENSFAAGIDFALPDNLTKVTIGDIDGDGKPDLAVKNVAYNLVSVFRNTSTPGSISSASFATRVDFTTGYGSGDVAIGDIDGDGRPDLVVANPNDNSISVLRNTGSTGDVSTGSFASKVDFAAGNNPLSVAIGDIDDDGKPDVIVANFNSNTVSVFRNTSTSGSIETGSFASKVDFATGTGANCVAIGDLDGDGKIDLIVTNFNNNTVSAFRNTSTPGSIGAGSFAAKVDFTTGTGPNSVTIGDIDGDGKPDIAVAGSSSGYAISVLRNTSSSGQITSASFAGKVDFDSGGSSDIALGDLNGDCKPDLVVTSHVISVLRNTISENVSVPPVIESFSPTSGPVGTTVTITGMNFSTNSADNNVSFGGNQATVISATTTQLTVTVPNLTGDHNIIVTVNGLTTYSNESFSITSPGDSPSQDSFQFESSVLTLNGDGINDRLVIKNFETYGKCSISVFNSRGVLIYSNKDYLNDWDMCINGRELNTGGYFYIAETESGVFRGSFSILRRF